MESAPVSYGDYPDLRDVKKILVVKLRHLGDSLLAGPVFSALKRALPEAKIDAYIYSESKPMLEGHPDVDGFVLYDRKWKKLGFLGRMWKELQLLRQIRKKGYDLVINLTEGDRGAIAAYVSGARIRVGTRGKGTTHLVKNCPGLRHTVERNLDAVRRIGIFPPQSERALSLALPKSAKLSARLKAGASPFVLIHPTSRWRFKCWPKEKMRALVEYLVERGKRVVISSGPDVDERQMADEIGKGLPVVNLGGALTLKELGSLIEMSELLICVDSVPFHMASALKAKVLAIFGPTSEVTWGAWQNPNARVIAKSMSCRPCYRDGCGGSKRSDCLETLSVEEVISELEILSEVGAPCGTIGEKGVDGSA
jgi:heptosyltransferase-3